MVVRCMVRVLIKAGGQCGLSGGMAGRNAENHTRSWAKSQPGPLLGGLRTALIGVGRAGYPAPPPSEPDGRFSRIRLSGWWFYLNED